MHHFLNHKFDYALILSGDQLYQMDYNELINAHVKNGADITIATLPVLEKEATDFGILKTDKKGFIKEFIEKPSADLLPDWTSEVSDEMKQAGKNHLASMGIYVFNRDLLVKQMQNEDTKDFAREIIPEAITGNKKVLSFPYEGYWTDIGNIESFFEANLELTDDIPEFNLFDNSKVIYTRARLLPPSKISGTTLERTVISDGCIILASRIEHSVIGIRARIGKGTTIVNSIIMGCDYYQKLDEIQSSETNKIMGVGERCYLNRCIVDKNCIIGNDVRINGGKHLPETDTELYSIKDGIVILKKGAVIPNGFSL
jgi:glucose-1-phosphate adenylyltransferase